MLLMTRVMTFLEVYTGISPRGELLHLETGNTQIFGICEKIVTHQQQRS
jgi:hypothetical protein